MKKSGQIVLFKFPQTDQGEGKLRPALLLGKIPGKFDDWLVCMISSQVHQKIEDYDELILQDDNDFSLTGLKTNSLIRIFRLAVVQENILIGSIGEISSEKLSNIKNKISLWLNNN